MEEEQTYSKQIVHTVTNIGNSWIICRSKSHCGRIYYFNTLTGEAAWNLSETEIEKARSTTQSLGGQQSLPLNDCPEPKEPPLDPSSNSSCKNKQRTVQNPVPSRIYNKQIINNSFSKESCLCQHGIPHPGSSNLAATAYNPNAWNVPLANQHMAPTVMPCPSAPNMIPTSFVNASQNSVKNLHNNQVHRPVLNMAPTNTAESNHAESSLNIAASHQHHNGIVPDMIRTNNTFFKQAEYSYNMPYGNQVNNGIVQNTAPHLSSFQNLHQRPCITPPPQEYETENQYIPRVNDNRLQQKGQSRLNFHNKLDSQDLRQFISAKKNFHVQDPAEMRNNELSNDFEEQQQNFNRIETTDESYNSDADGDWLEENVDVRGSKLNLDLTNLKKLAKDNSNPKCWYIAVDKNILLHHINLLNILIYSDTQCHLMTSSEMISELRDASKCGAPRFTRRARRALKFVSQQRQQDDCCAIMDEEHLDTTSTENPYLLGCCLSLVAQNYHVVLLTNDVELQSYRTTTDIAIFSIKELKDLLTNETIEPETETHVTDTFCHDSPNIEITFSNSAGSVTSFSNDLHELRNDLVTRNKLNKKTRSEANIPVKENHSKYNATENKGSNIACRSIPVPSKCTVETGVQTELASTRLSEPLASKKVHRVASATSAVKYENSSSQASGCSEKRTINKLQNNTQSNTSSKIRLKRSTSSKPAVSNDIGVERKQFKWRRRRNISSTNETKSSINSHVRGNDTSNSRTQTDAVTAATNNDYKTNVLMNSIRSPSELINTRNNTSYGVAEGSETSNSIILQRSVTENIIIEETSTSGVISNTTSNIGSESDGIHQSKLKFSLNSTDNKTVKNNVMFKVISQGMEEYLIMRCDEWISRFVQIMEEVLTQVLQLDSKSPPNMVPAPWSIQEATQCICMKFKDCDDVTDAASKFLNVLKRISHDRDRISMEISPSDYMEMYSYGVYLVETLQSTLYNCEDLLVATDSLSKLLNDIRNPNLDTSHNDSFADNVCKSSVPDAQTANTGLQKAVINETENEIRKAEDFQQKANGNNAVSSSYNFRSKRRKADQDVVKKLPKPKFVRDIDNESTFFTSLNLQKKISDGHDKATEILNNINIPQGVPNGEQISSDFPRCVKKLGFDNNQISKIKKNESKNKTENEVSVQPKIIRSFELWPEFKNNLSTINGEALGLDADKYPVDHEDDYIDNEYCIEDKEVYSEDDAGDHVIDNDEHINKNGCCDDENARPDVNGNNEINGYFIRFINEIKEAFAQVNAFCVNTQKELSHSGLSNNRTKAVHEKAEKAYSNIDNIYKFLNSIFYRETSDNDDNIQSLLSKAGFHQMTVSDKLIEEYRDIIAKCMDQAKILLESVHIIITVVKS